MSTIPVWRKSSHSSTQQGDCVEVAHLEHRVGVRDSKAPDAGHLSFTVDAFVDLVARVKAVR